MTKTISIIATKGGAGKTTLAASLAGHFANEGKKTLMIDGDPQPTLSSYYSLTEEAFDNPPQCGFSEVITRAAIHKDCIYPTNIFGLDIIQNNDPDNRLLSFIKDQPDGYVRLRSAIKESAETLKDYDYVIVDSIGATSPLQSVCAIAGDILVSPVKPEMLNAREFMRGTVTLYDRHQGLRRLGISLSPLLAVMWQVSKTNDAKFISEEFHTQVKRKGSQFPIKVAKTQIPDRVCFPKAATISKPVHEVSKEVGEIIAALADEIVREISAGGSL